MDPLAANYDATATYDDGSCAFPLPSCTDDSGTTYTIGQNYAGWFQIFYLAGSGCGSTTAVEECTNAGETSPTCGILMNGVVDSSGYDWGCLGENVGVSGVVHEVIGAWYQNNIDIIAFGPGNCTGWGATQAIDITNINQQPGGHDDWYLPSVDEMSKLRDNIGPGDLYGLGNVDPVYGQPVLELGNSYWSSTEDSVNPDYLALAVVASNGNTPAISKSSTNNMKHVSIRRAGPLGCTDPAADNQDLSAVWDDGSCTYPLGVGDVYAGGVIFYLNNGLDISGGGLVVSDGMSTFISEPWGCDGTAIPGADGAAIGTGAQNTLDIISGCSTAGIAADQANSFIWNGYTDWYLPSSLELLEIFATVGDDLNGIQVGLGPQLYWSSTEESSTVANAVTSYPNNSGPGNIWQVTKLANARVRPIRAF